MRWQDTREAVRAGFNFFQSAKGADVKLIFMLKKIFVILVVVVGFDISANAGVVFRSQQSVCSGSEQIILKSNGTVQIWNNSTLRYSGTYTIEGKIIIMSVEGGQFRATAEMNDSKTILVRLNFNNNWYNRCNK